jgi:hypothetical protein
MRTATSRRVAIGRAGLRGRALALALAALAAGCGTKAGAPPRPTAIVPDRGAATAPVAIRIRGTFGTQVSADFSGDGGDVVDARYQARLGSTPLDDVALRQDGGLDATVPAGLAPGTYDLTVVDPDGRAGTLPQAYRVLAPGASTVAVAGFRVAAVGAQVAYAPFTVTVTAVDAEGAVVADYAGEARLSDRTGTVAPPSVGLFVDGSWTGTVEVRAAHASDVLTVAEAGGGTGASAPFPVAPAPVAAVRFATAAPAPQAGACTGPVTLALRDAFGQPTTAAAALALSVAAAPAAGFTLYGDGACTAALGAPTVAAGQGTVSVWFIATAAGALQLTASGAALGGDVQAATVAAGAPARLFYTTAAQTVTAGDCSGAVTVEARDPYGNLASFSASAATPLTLTSTPAGLVFFAGTGCTGGAPGFAAGATSTTFSFRGNAAGAVTVNAGTGAVPPEPHDETIVAATPARLFYTTAAQTVTAGDCSGAVTVEARDAYGNLASFSASAATPLTLTSTPAGLVFFAGTGCTGGAPGFAAGATSATFSFRGNAAGAVRVNAGTGTVPPEPQDETIVAATPARLFYTTAAQTVTAGDCSGAVTVEARDAYGNLASFSASAATPLTLTSTPAGLVFFAGTGCTGGAPGFAAGATSATFSFRGNAAGAVTVNAGTGTVPPEPQDETIVAATPARLFYTTAAQTVTAGDCSGAVTVEARDAYGNLASFSASAATPLTLTSTPAGLVFFAGTGCTGGAVSFAAGATSATFSFRGNAAGAVRVNAGTGAVPPEPQDETIVAGATDHVTWSTIASPQPQGSAFTVTLTAADAHGNRTTYAGTATLSASASSVSCVTGCTSASETGAFTAGQWTGSVVVPDAVTGLTLTATVGASGRASNAFDVVGGPASRSPPFASFVTSARVVTSGNAVTFDAGASSDYQTPAAALSVSWHFEALDADQASTVAPGTTPTWTTWSTARTASHSFINNTGAPIVYRPRLAVRDTEAGPGGPDVGYASGVVVVLPDASNVCVVDTDSLVDDSLGSTTCNVKGGDGRISLTEAIRVANGSLFSTMNIVFDTTGGPRNIVSAGGVTLNVTRAVRIVANPGSVTLDRVSLAISGSNVLVSGLEFTRLATAITVTGEALLEDLHVHGGRGIEVQGRARILRARMSACSGGAPCLLESGGGAYLAVFFSDLAGTGSDVGIALDACANTPPYASGSSPYLAFVNGWSQSGAAFVGGTVLTGFGTGIVLGGSCAEPWITNVTFDRNVTGLRATQPGGYLTDAIFTRQSGAAMDPAVCALAVNARSLVWQNGSNGCAGSGTALVTEDPLYVYPSARDYRIQYASPAKDSGEAGNTVEVDDAGPGDYLGARPDRGGRETY